MSDEKLSTPSCESDETDDSVSRAKAIDSLLDLSTEDFLLDKLDQESTLKKCKKEIYCGWQNISATCTYKQKIPNKPKNKKNSGTFSHVSSTISQNEQKNMKFLFSNSLQYMVASDSHEYKPSNGVYRTMKFADASVDPDYNKQLVLKKPIILLPLNKYDIIPKDILLLADHKTKPVYSPILSYVHPNQESSLYIPNIARLHVTGDCSHIQAKNLHRGDWNMKCKSAEERRLKLQSIAEKTILSDSKKRQLLEQNRSLNSKTKPIWDHTLSVVKLKVLADQKKNTTDCSQDYINLRRSLSSLTLKDKYVSNKKEPKIKRPNTDVFKHRSAQSATLKNRTHSAYTSNMKSDVAVMGTKPFVTLGQDLSPLITGKRLYVCPSIQL